MRSEQLVGNHRALSSSGNALACVKHGTQLPLMLPPCSVSLRLPSTRALALAALLVAAPPARAQDSAVADPVAAAARQVDVGQQWFRSICLECHGTSSMSNTDFKLKWGGKNAFDLWETIRSTMPESDPGSLSGPTYTAIVAYILKLNGFPPRTTALATDSTALAAVSLAFPSAASGPTFFKRR